MANGVQSPGSAGKPTHDFAESYNSFAGIDITAVFNGLEVGTLQAISWNTTRERGPIYTMGHTDPVSFARGKRGIAGSLVFITFDRNELLHAMQETKFWADRDSISLANVDNIGALTKDSPISGGDTTLTLKSTDTSILPNESIQTRIGTAEANQSRVEFFSGEGGVKVEHSAWYTDQLMPFDITLLGANEYGHAITRKIFGVEILNEGGGVSIDDLVLENQMSFVARHITPWLPAKGG